MSPSDGKTNTESSDEVDEKEDVEEDDGEDDEEDDEEEVKDDASLVGNDEEESVPRAREPLIKVNSTSLKNVVVGNRKGESSHAVKSAPKAHVSVACTEKGRDVVLALPGATKWPKDSRVLRSRAKGKMCPNIGPRFAFGLV